MPSAERVLVDTHALLWWQAQPGQARPDRISTTAWERITAASCALVSPISCWEVAMLVGKERIRLDRPTAAWIRDVLATDGIGVAELTPRIAVAAAELVDFHGDPADRFLYATARLLGVPLLSKDRLLHGYAEADRTVTVIW
ncbi:MAG: type II toxin-antitoxin system VapC family toxin [Actinomycetota bacterium]|nr:type II toxin-antitoxin system VapC family toxin [Actinomycetota bacterium]